MRSHRGGFALVDLLLGMVVLLLGLAAATRVIQGATTAIGDGRRWSAMAFAATRELARLERGYLATRPACPPPPAGSLLGADGVSLRWTGVGDSVGAVVTMEVRASSARRVLLDTVVAGFLCR